MNTKKRNEIVRDLKRMAKEYDRRGDIVLREQSLRQAREICGTSAAARRDGGVQ